jgi:hypothetical protein
MTNAQERKFYREAVQASLQEFYGKSEAESKRLVRDWWKRLSATRAFESGLFMHSEPINTAARIANVRVVPITSKNREFYHRILEHSRDLVLSQVKTRRAHKNIKPTNFIATATSESSGPKLSKEQIIHDIAKKMDISLKKSERYFDLLAQTAVNQHQTARSAEFYIAGIGQVVKAERRASVSGRQNTSEIIKRARAKGSLEAKAKKKVAQKQVRVAVG